MLVFHYKIAIENVYNDIYLFTSSFYKKMLKFLRNFETLLKWTILQTLNNDQLIELELQNFSHISIVFDQS